MKLKLFFVGMLLILVEAGCNKDAFIPDNTSGTLKSAKMVPIKGDMTAIITFPTSFALVDGKYTPVKGEVTGTVSHLGILQNGSYWKATRCIRHDDENPPYIDYGMEGTLVAANGDELNFTQDGKMYTIETVEGVNWNSTITYTGGTGRFEKAIGSGNCTGLLIRNSNDIPVSVPMKSEGLISNVGQNK